MYNKVLLDKLKESLVESHHNNAFLMGIISASLASIGLATNSQTTIIGSMLLSPIGSLITKNIIYTFLTKHNYKLDIKYKKWFFQVVMVLLFTLVISYLMGRLLQKLKNPFTNEEVTKEWPTSEMLDRAKPINAFYMILIALLCGIALPIALINNSSIKLVAIGIATALIPPIANTGIALSLQNNNEENNEYKKNAIITGISIFLINSVLLWVPSKFMLNEITKKHNVFKFIENVFIFPKILLNLKKYKFFVDLDKDGNGFIEKNEFIKSDKKVSKRELKKKLALFKKLDKDNSGKLSIREFMDIKD